MKKYGTLLAVVMLLGVHAPAQQFPPGFVDPVRGKTIQQLLDECADQSYVRSVGDLGAWRP